ncbi:hypothetical protein EYF80_032800 [Liparis tanakae]|uniref:Uncharacterized protein n=1 Tax=Liparis tanakae TaxID=230148 RepID=A0A4Z2GU87_9TELE|nr:hypothetical protein EYF80_032800 [Liparis tanakae]
MHFETSKTHEAAATASASNSVVILDFRDFHSYAMSLKPSSSERHRALLLNHRPLILTAFCDLKSSSEVTCVWPTGAVSIAEDPSTGVSAPRGPRGDATAPERPVSVRGSPQQELLCVVPPSDTNDLLLLEYFMELKETLIRSTRVLDVVPEVLGHKVVDERVQAAVEARQAQRGHVEAVAVVRHAVLQQRVVHHQHHVAGHEAHHKGHQHHGDQHHGPPPVLGRRAVPHAVPQDAQQQDVGHDDDHAGHEEHHQAHEDEVVVRQAHGRERVQGVLDDVDVVAGGDVGVLDPDGVVVQVQRRAGEPHERPDGHADADGHLVVLPLLRQRVSYHPVALHAEAGDEEDGAVHVAVEEAHHHFAQRLAVRPVVAVEVVRDLQRDPDDEEQVGQRQVGHVDGGRVLLLGPEEEHPDGHAVGRQPHGEHHDVDDGEEDGGEVTLQRVGRRLVHNYLHSVLCVFPESDAYALAFLENLRALKETLILSTVLSLRQRNVFFT